jgi:hypothetical protein
MSDPRSGSDASLPPFNERLRQLLDNAAAGIRASRTEIERAATYVETARRLLDRGQTSARPLTYAVRPHLSSAPSRWFVSSRSYRRAFAVVPSRRHGPRRPPVPGARLPCTRTGCLGTMHYSRDLGGHLQTAVSAMTAEAERGWVCSDRAGHVHQAPVRYALQPEARLTTRARWEDDGGSSR